MDRVTTYLAATVDALGLGLSEDQLDRLARYRDLLSTSANEFNLTSLRDPQSIERRHIVESLAFGAFLQVRGLLPSESGAAARPASVSPRPVRAETAEGLAAPMRVLDIGTGAGLPGIPIKIGWPEMSLTLLESAGKKCRFLEQACEALGLEDVLVVEGRAEDVGRDAAHRETYDLVIARAVAPLPVLLEYALPALRIGGWLTAPKGSAALSELDASAKALDALGGRLYDAAPFQPPEGLRQTVVLVEKVAPTPERYPRRAGIPSKRPL
jgi:16S rRNA (guanine527-N7)-methyltransferase